MYYYYRRLWSCYTHACVLCNKMASRKIDYDFVELTERPSQDFFCPVSLELLLEPQLTSCCGHHLSLEVVTRLQREGKACPMYV